MLRFTVFFLLIIVYAEDVSCKKLRQENSPSQSAEDASGERTMVISNLVLLPIMAGVGVKFLILLPIILSKIALLGILSFVSSNLSLLVSAIMGVRSYFFDDNSTEENYEYDDNYKGRYESDDLHKYGSHKDPHDDSYRHHHYHEDNYDPHDKYKHRYNGHDLSHLGYNSYHPQYKYHDDHNYSKKRFRPFKLLERIKDVIKDHFHKPRGGKNKYYRYDHDYKYNSPDISDDHSEYNHEIHDTRYTIPDYVIASHQSGLKGRYYEGYKVPQDWSLKDEVRSNLTLKSEKHQDRVISDPAGLLNGQLKIPTKENDGESMSSNPNLTQLQTTKYKIYENDPTFKEPFIVFGVRPEAQDSDSAGAFYATDYKNTDFQTVPQADTSK